MSVDEDRRAFLARVAVLAGAMPLGLGVGSPSGAVGGLTTSIERRGAAEMDAATGDSAGYQFFGPGEAMFVEALVNIMCPADQYTANGVDCGLATYIDRQLAGAFGQGHGRYTRGPWHQGKPELGNQLPLTPAEFFKAGLAAASDACVQRHRASFDQLSPDDANAFLEDLRAGRYVDPRVPLGDWFNELVYPLFVQACFADPLYGGNNDKVFWKLIGYPGLPATHALDMVQYRGKPYPGAQNPRSIADFS
jgi:gluconate 2-dehydrogenase gamma chain